MKNLMKPNMNSPSYRFIGKIIDIANHDAEIASCNSAIVIDGNEVLDDFAEKDFYSMLRNFRFGLKEKYEHE